MPPKISASEVARMLSTALQVIYIKPTTRYGYFPPEIWMAIANDFEEQDDRAALGALANCSKVFNDLMRPYLYERFITDACHIKNPRSVAGFMCTVSRRPDIAACVKVVKIDTLVAPGDRWINCRTILPKSLLHYFGKALQRNFTDLSREEIKPIFLQLLELLPGMLPNVQLYKSHAGKRKDEMNVCEEQWGYIQRWGMTNMLERPKHLTSLSLVQNKPRYYFTAFHILDQWVYFAPRVRSIDIRIMPRDFRQIGGRKKLVRDFWWNSVAGPTYERLRDVRNNLSKVINNLQDVSFHVEEFTEATELFYFLWRSRNVVRVELTFIPRPCRHPRGLFGCVTDCIELYESVSSCLIGVGHAVDIPVFDDGNPRWSSFFTLRYQENVKEVIVNQSMLVLAALLRQKMRHMNDMLATFIPSGVVVLRLMNITTKMMNSIRKFIQRIKSGHYPNLEALHIIQTYQKRYVVLHEGEPMKETEFGEIKSLLESTKVKLILKHPSSP